MEIYDNLGFEWLPFIMFSQSPNYRSKIINTDNKGFRFNSIPNKEEKSVLESLNKKENILILGNSTAFGVGATSDDKTISSYLTDKNTNYINLACRAHVGFQELINLYSNLHKLLNIKKIIIISGINDFYLSNIIPINYPDNFYFNSSFIENMNRSRITKYHKYLKPFLDLFYPKVLNNENLWKLNKVNLLKFVTSSKFRETFKSKEIYYSMKLEEKLNRNFILYKSLQKFFDCEVNFYLQPVLQWSKEMSNEETNLFEYSNKYSSDIGKQAFSLFTSDNYNFLSSLLIKISKKYEINFYDINSYFKDTLKKNDWHFVDAVHCTDIGYKNISEFIKINN